MVTRRAKRAQRQLGVVSRGGRLLDDGRALGLEAGQQDGALHLGARHFGPIADALQRRRREWSAAACPSCDSIRAPICSSGTMTRPMGRLVSDASPLMTEVNGCAASTPDSSRIVVPGILGIERRGRRPKPTQPAADDFDRQARVRRDRVSAISTPALTRQSSVAAQSAPERILVDRGSTRRQGRQQRVSMGNGFVAGKPDRPLDATGRPHRRSGD